MTRKLPARALQQRDIRSEHVGALRLARFVARARAGVQQDYRGEVQDKIAPELPTRLAQQLASLLAGMDAIGVPRPTALMAVRNTALGCIPAARKEALDYLNTEGKVTTKAAAVALKHPTFAAKRTLEQLTVHGLVERSSEGDGHADHWELSARARDAFASVLATPSGISPEGASEAEIPHQEGDSEPPGEDPEHLPEGDTGAPSGDEVGDGCISHPDEPDPGCRYCRELEDFDKRLEEARRGSR